MVRTEADRQAEVALAAAIAQSGEARRILIDGLVPPEAVAGPHLRRFIARRLCGEAPDTPDKIIVQAPAFRAARPADDAAAARVAGDFARRWAWTDLGAMLDWTGRQWRSGRLARADVGELLSALERAGFAPSDCAARAPEPGDALAGWRGVVAGDGADAVAYLVDRAQAETEVLA